MPLAPIVMPYLALILLFFNRVIIGTLALLAAALISPTTWNRSGAASLMARDWRQITYSPQVIVIVLIVIGLIVIFLLFIELFGVGFNSFARTIATMVCIALIPTVVQLYPLPINNKFYTQLIRQPWLPAETITLRSGENFIGYVLSDTGTWIEVLKDGTRTIYYYLDSDIIRRQICRIGQAPPMQPLITLTPSGTSVSSLTPICQITPARPSRPDQHNNQPTPVRGPRP